MAVGFQKFGRVGFDPFNDRRARDIRNNLSTVFVEALRHPSDLVLQQQVDKWLEAESTGVYHDYIIERRQRFEAVLNCIRQFGIDDPLEQSLILWNHGLFFEVHELLETLWQRTTGKLRIGLKGLIQASGVFVHLEYNRRQAALSLARRALLHLAEGRSTIDRTIDMECLVGLLHRLAPGTLPLNRLNQFCPTF